MVSAGRVLLMPKGEYNAATTYQLLDIVSYNGSSYIAKGETTGNLPTNTTYWQLSAYGGDAANVSANFATVETTAYASQHYDVGNLLINASSQLCEVTTEILQGDEIILYPETGNNVKLTDVETLLAAVEDSVASVASDLLDVEASIADIEASTTATAAHAIGDQFYLNNVLYEAIAAITIGDTIVLPPDVNATVKVADTVIEQIEAVEDDLDTLDSAKQNKTLDTPITIGGVQETTVEGALGGLKEALTDEVTSYQNVYGCKQLIPFPYSATQSGGLTWTTDSNGVISVSGTIPSTGVSDYGLVHYYDATKSHNLCEFVKSNNVKIVIDSGESSVFTVRVAFFDSSKNALQYDDYVDGSYSIATSHSNAYYFTIAAMVHGTSGQSVSISNIKIMLCDANVMDDTYVPYAMTNREFTDLSVIKDGTFTGTEYWTVGKSRSRVSKEGHIAILHFKTSTSETDKIPSQVDTILGTVSIHPTYELSVMVNFSNRDWMIIVDTSGNIRAYNYSSEAAFMGFNLMIPYFCQD